MARRPKGLDPMSADFAGMHPFTKDEPAGAFLTNNTGMESLRITIGIFGESSFPSPIRAAFEL